MKTDRIRINKTPQQPEGVEVELVKPENATEGELLSFLLTGYVRDLKKDGRLPYEVPEKFGIRHQNEGSFILSGYFDESKFYEPPQPILIIGIQVRQGKFNLIHAAVQPRGQQQQQPQPTPTEPAPQPAADEHTTT
jgi:hypothetical protein